MRISLAATIGLLLLISLASAQVVVRQAKFKLASYSTYVQFAHELTADKITVKSDRMELTNARMANSPPVNTSFSVSAGNLTIAQLFTNGHFISYLYLPSGNNSTVRVLIPSGIWVNDRFSVVANISQYAYIYNSTSRMLTISLAAESAIKLEITKLVDGESCSLDEECLNGYCVHGICRSAPTYCGDGYCDHNLGERWTNCWEDCGFRYRPCRFDFELNYQEEVRIPLNRTKKIEVTLVNTGTCRILPSQLIVRGILEDWFELEPSASSPLGRDEKFDFVLTIEPAEEGTHKLSLSLFNEHQKTSIAGLNKTFYLTVEVPPALPVKCPPCPPCSEWGDCIDNEQTRICYKCSEANYTCQPYEESRRCGPKIQPTPAPTGLHWYEKFLQFLSKLFEMNILFMKLFAMV